MPSLPEYYVPNDCIDDLVDRLNVNKCLYIFGISGIGKSLLSVEIANNVIDNYDAIYYIDGNNIKNVEALEAVELVGNNGTINLLGNIKRPGSLIIIDDLKACCESISKK